MDCLSKGLESPNCLDTVYVGMETDEIRDELEHQQFMDECRKLVEEISWKISNATDPAKVVNHWFDIATFGFEPAFDSVFADRLIAE